MNARSMNARSMSAGLLPAGRRSGSAVSAGTATLETCIATTLFGLIASTSLGASTLAQREATDSSLRQHALALAAERLDLLAGGLANDDAAWQGRVAAALPGGEGSLVASGNSLLVQVRWRLPGSQDARCPGTNCVALQAGR